MIYLRYGCQWGFSMGRYQLGPDWSFEQTVCSPFLTTVVTLQVYQMWAGNSVWTYFDLCWMPQNILNSFVSKGMYRLFIRCYVVLCCILLKCYYLKRPMLCNFIATMFLNTGSGGIDIFEVKLTFEMLTVRGQHHSFSTYERVSLRKCQSFWDRKCLDRGGLEPPIFGFMPNTLTYWAIRAEHLLSHV